MQKSISVIKKKELTKDSKNLFLVSTVMHLFNAIEAQNHFNTPNNILVLLFYGSGTQDEYNVLKYLNLFPYDQLITFKPPKNKLYHTLNLKLIELINQHCYRYVFLGYFSANLRRFVCNFNYKKLFLYDDGTYTIALHNELYCSTNKPILIKKYSEQKRKKKINQIIFLLYDFYRRYYFRLHGYKNDFSSDIDLNFFTIFKLSPCKKEIIINHSLNIIKTFFLNPITQYNSFSQTVFFLGQPLHKVFNIEKHEYLSYLIQVQNFYEQKNLKMIYVAHRSEQKEIIQEIGTLTHNSFQVLSLDIPIEIHLLENNIEVHHISSFFSSGLFTLKTLYPNSHAEAFKIYYNTDIRHDINIIYDCIENSNMDIIKLESSNGFR